MTDFAWVGEEISAPSPHRRPPAPLKRVVAEAVEESLPNPADLLRMQYRLGIAPPPHFHVIVVGDPAPQGSKVPGGRTKDGRIAMRESSKRVKPWREDVESATLKIVSPDDGMTLHPGFPLAGPLMGEIILTRPKPKSAPKRRVTYPATHGNDVSKLVRSTEDALVKIMALEDDGLIIEYLRVAKVYPGEDVDALAMPGAVIRFWAVDRLPC